MKINLAMDMLVERGLDDQTARQLLTKLEALAISCDSAEAAWSLLSTYLYTAQIPFDIHCLVFSVLFPEWHTHPETAPAWLPTPEILASSNISHFMHELGLTSVKTLHDWSVTHVDDFWSRITRQLGIVFDKMPAAVCDLSQGITSPVWFPDATMNIINSCFTANKSATAIIYEDADKNLVHLSYDDLNRLSNRVANSLIQSGFAAGDAIGIAMPMNYYAVAIYLGIIKMGGVVVSIADSFSSEEMATRLNIANAKAIFTQDFTLWGSKQIPLYEKVMNSRTLPDHQSNLNTLRIIVTPCESRLTIPLHKNDMAWEHFLVDESTFTPISCNPMAACNILFSSGTTGVPKAIAWNHTTPIKAASDAFFHQNIQQGDILAWPTNLGWMMGPWLIFAALINQATIALYTGAPKDRAFGEFIQNAKVTMLGVVPTLVATWRQSKCMEHLDWSAIKAYSSTGECSNPDDMLYLMSLAGYKPVIEYCGGTEIGGAYLSSTMVENNYPSLFTTPTMGMNIVILDDEGHPATLGEVAIIPPSIGLSTHLLNADHHHVYFENMPTTQDGRVLRRHGDQIKQLENKHFCILGRVDDTMNLGGIKISAAEIERTLTGFNDIIEVAAIAIPPANNGPSLLIIYAAASGQVDKSILIKEMQKKINTHLNPLFKIHDVVLRTDLPKTASNKIMRRVLRKQYMEGKIK